MKQLLVLMSLILLSTTLVAQVAPVARPRSLVFNHVTVIDMTGASPQPDLTVVIAGNRVAALGKPGTVRVPENAEVIDGTGKFLIPGLWDMHAHVFHYRLPLPPDEYSFPLFIANGVTSVREMWTRVDRMDQIRLWRKDFADRRRIVPRFAAVGTLVDGPPATWANSDTVSTAGEARLMVRKIKAGGADFLKVYDHLSREAYFAIADEAKKQRLPFAGHVPETITVREASDAGQRSLEHLRGFSPPVWLSCPNAKVMAEKILPELIANGSPATHVIEENLKLCADEKAALALYQRLAKNLTWQVPTLVLLKALSSELDTLYADDRLKYLPGGKDHFNDWDTFHDERRNRTAAEWDEARAGFQRALETVGAMHRAGVRFMAGTDVSNPYIYAGFSLHDELALFVQAGLTPMEALQTATRNPAEFLGMSGSLGTIERDKFADLILLEANPLEDIRNTRRISAVVVNGRYLPKEMLQKMLAEAEAAPSKR